MASDEYRPLQQDDLPELPPEAPPSFESGSPAPGGVDLGPVLAGLAAIDERLGQFHERARHRESVIDRLHAENQELRAGERRSLLDPVITDVIRLHDQLEREAAGLSQRGEEKVGALLSSLADDALLTLERMGVERFTAEAGDRFRPEIHRPLSAIDDPDPARGNTIARVVTQGFRDAQSGRVRRKVQAHFYRHVDGSTEPSR